MSKIDEKISQAKAKLLVEYPLFGTIASKINLVVNDDIQAFKSDGIKLEYNSDFMQNISVNEMEFIFANGAMHASLAHESRKNNRSGWLWQMATDMAINDMLVQNGMDLPDGAQYRKRFEGMYAEEIYAELKDDILRDELEYEADDELDSRVKPENDGDDEFENDGDDKLENDKDEADDELDSRVKPENDGDDKLENDGDEADDELDSRVKPENDGDEADDELDSRVKPENDGDDEFENDGDDKLENDKDEADDELDSRVKPENDGDDKLENDGDEADDELDSRVKPENDGDDEFENDGDDKLENDKDEADDELDSRVKPENDGDEADDELDSRVKPENDGDDEFENDGDDEFENDGDDELDNSVIPSLTGDLEEQLFSEFAQTVLENELKTDDLPLHVERFFTLNKSAKIDWREELKYAIDRFYKDDYTLMPPNKKFLYTGIYLPSSTSQRFKLVVAVDSSGSIDEELLNTFLSELNFLMSTIPNYEIELLVCDEKIQSHKTFYSGDILEVDVRGGGATNFKPVFDFISENLQDTKLLLYFSDLDGVFPKDEPNYDVKWVSPRQIKVPFGNIIVLD